MKMNVQKSICFVAVAYQCMFTSIINAEDNNIKTEVVDEITFEGLDFVEPEAIQECVTIKPYEKFEQKDIDNTLNTLFSKGFFANIKFVRRGRTLIIKCTERPLIEQVAFEGNDAASDDALHSVINGRIDNGRLLSMHQMKDVLSDFQLLYRALGFCSAVVTPKIIRRPGNKVDVVFEIVEGEKTTVKKIMFVGNKHFDDDILKDLISIKEEKIWRFWDSDSHIFREDKIDRDKEVISAFYKNRGYPFFAITHTHVEMSFDKKSHYCTIMMEEGDKYTIKSVSLVSNIKKIKADDFKENLDITLGSDFNEALINYNRDKLRRVIAQNDNPFIDVSISIDFDKTHKTASLQYCIMETPKTFLERLEIYGNTKTLDNVIRREFSIHEGDAMNIYKIQSAVERLRGSGYFDDVEITEIDGSAEDKKILQVTVKESERTAQLQFGGNASSIDGFGGTLGFAESNLMGTGRSLSTDMFWMQKYYGCSIDLFDPRVMDNNFGAGLSIGASSYDRKRVSQSIMRSAYISPYVRYSLAQNLFHTMRITVSHNNKRWWDKKNKQSYGVIPPDIEKTVVMRDEYGKYSATEVSSTLTYDKTDNPYNPRGGYELTMKNSYAGIFGNVRYFKNDFGMKYYYAITERITFIAAANCGFIQESKGTRSQHRFSLGGDGISMRGFDVDGVGPRDKKGNSVGGKKYWTMSFMAKTPLSAKEIGINGVVFLDFGSAWGTKYAKKDVNDSKAIRSSIGVGIEWARSPLGVPLSFVFGFPIKKQSFDEKRTFTLMGLM